MKKETRVKKEEAKPIDIALGFRGENLNKPYLVTLNRVNRPAQSPRTPPLLCTRRRKKQKDNCKREWEKHELPFCRLISHGKNAGIKRRVSTSSPATLCKFWRSAERREIMAPLFNAALITKLIQLHSSTCSCGCLLSLSLRCGDTPPANPRLGNRVRVPARQFAYVFNLIACHFVNNFATLALINLRDVT